MKVKSKKVKSIKVKSIVDYVPDTGTTFTEESQTRQSDYEDINTTVSRIIRGEIIPQMPDEFEYDGTDDVDDIFDAEHPLDAEALDISDTGSLYQDDMRSGIQQVLFGKTEEQKVTNQERELSGANKQSSSETNVPVDNFEKQEQQ